MMVLFYSIVSSLLILRASAGEAAPLFLGRVLQGEWKDYSYELMYYVDIMELSGPAKKKKCLIDSLKAAFSGGGKELRQAQWERIHQDHKNLASKEKAEQENQLFQASNRVGKDEQEGDRIAYLQALRPQPKPRITTKYHGGVGHPPARGRTGLAYRFDSNLAVYLDGQYMDVFDDAPKGLEDFLQTTVPFLVAAPARSRSGTLENGAIMDAIDQCTQALPDDETLWEAGDVDLLTNTPLLGRSASGVWQGLSFEIVSFLEVFRLMPPFDQDHSETQECFYNAMDNLFFENQIGLLGDNDSKVLVSDLTTPKLGQQLRSFALRQEQQEDSLFSTNSLGSTGCSGFSIQHGVAIFLNGEMVESFASPALPDGLEDFVKSVWAALVSTPFEWRDSMDTPYEISSLENDQDLTFVLAEWMDACQYPSSESRLGTRRKKVP